VNSEYIVYVDESGDHSLESIDESYPIFVLSFCVFKISDYTASTAPALRALKFELFGHDMVVFHEIEIRRKRGPFATLQKEPRELLMERLTEIVSNAPLEIVAVIIDKKKHRARYAHPAYPYHLAFEFGLERLYRLMRAHGQDGRTTHIVCEARGAKEDVELELEFRRIRDGANYQGPRLPFELVMADKKTNSEGLQLADLTARPIGLSYLRPDQQNRAYEALEPKICRDSQGRKSGYGLKVFP
jgi:hypothetical protein